MIDEKKIEEAAANYAESNWISDDCYNACEDGFHAGVNWLLDNLWHEATDEPKPYTSVLVKTHNEGEYYIECNSDNWEQTVLIYGITHWLYIDELIKK